MTREEIEEAAKAVAEYGGHCAEGENGDYPPIVAEVYKWLHTPAYDNTPEREDARRVMERVAELGAETLRKEASALGLTTEEYIERCYAEANALGLTMEEG